MKKNASCRAMKTSCSPTNQMLPQYLKPNSPLYKKNSPVVDLCMQKLANPSRHELMPSSAKYQSYDDWIKCKKLIVNSKPINNQNYSHINLNQHQAYNGLKNKITNLEGRLLEIKKNFEHSFINKKSQNKETFHDKNKENESTLYIGQGIKEKVGGKLKLVLENSKQNSKIQQLKGERTNEGNKTSTSKSKQSLSKMVPLKYQQEENAIQMKKKHSKMQQERQDNNNNNILHDYVTTFKCEPRTNTLIQCTSEANIFKFKDLQPEREQSLSQKYYITALINAFSNPKPTSFDQLCKNHLTTSIDILAYIKSNIKRLPSNAASKPLPPTHKSTIIFDLDETLIHCNENTSMPCDIALPIKFPNNSIVKAGINVRPYARECLRELAKHFELIVFTASHQCYGNVIVDYLDSQKQFISHRYFRDSCYKTEEGFYVKDLRVIDRDLKDVLLVDNAAYSYCFQLDNGIPIVPFYDNKADLQLKSLVTYLKQFIGVKDIRLKNGKQMKLAEYNHFRDPKTLINKLYQNN